MRSARRAARDVYPGEPFAGYGQKPVWEGSPQRILRRERERGNIVEAANIVGLHSRFREGARVEGNILECQLHCAPQSHKLQLAKLLLTRCAGKRHLPTPEIDRR